jgi:hypothetical protein
MKQAKIINQSRQFLTENQNQIRTYLHLNQILIQVEVTMKQAIK